MGGHVKRFFLATVHVVEEAVASGNRASNRGNMIKESVANFLESNSIVHSIVIFYIYGFIHHTSPIVSSMCDMVLIDEA